MAIGYTIRTYQWFTVELPIEYFGAGAVGREMILNISRHGWQIVGSQAVQPGSTLTLFVVLPGQGIQTTIQQATVRW